MKREKINYLRQWRHDPIRVPLLLRGARQVGKSWLVQAFGQEFEYFIEINFEKDKRAGALFTEHIDIAEFVKKLNVYTGKPIIPGKTLLFLDEIQECPMALKYLRYFKEDYPELHVVAAGSLIEFTLEKIGMAVGRVEYLYLYPLSFMEFLTAVGCDHFREFILKGEIDGATHQLLLEQLRHYMWLGGMPAVVQAWTEFRDIRVCQRLQDRIIENYQDDFLKYAKYHQIEAVNKVFLSVPKQLGSKFIYQHVDQESKTYPIKQALSLLIKAGITYPCFHTSAQNYPLGAEIDIKKFKLFMFDIGIAQRMLGLDLAQWVTQPMEINYLGYMAEQLVAQEFIAYGDENKSMQLYYWQNETKTGNAEVDFITIKNKQVVPVEVKARLKGGMKSLKVYFETHPKTKIALKISEGQFAKQDHLQEIPLYAIEYWIQKILVV